jgi:hypothetical protein
VYAPFGGGFLIPRPLGEVDYSVWAGDPAQLLQFNQNTLDKNGKNIWRESFRVQDIDQVFPGNQTATDTDMSVLMDGLLTARFRTEEWPVYHAFVRENNAWASYDLRSGDKLFYYKDVDSSYKNTSGGNSIGFSSQNVDLPLVIYGTSANAATAEAVGLYTPIDYGLNAAQTVGIDKATGEVLYTRDRIMRWMLEAQYKANTNPPFVILRLKSASSGMLNPSNAGAITPNAQGIAHLSPIQRRTDLTTTANGPLPVSKR